VVKLLEVEAGKIGGKLDSNSDSQIGIYGTKDYYEYYQRLEPNLRNPKLPKPTYVVE
jgi:hypothetical protein